MHMKQGVLTAFITLAVTGWASTQPVIGNPMDSWAWKNRPLIIVAPDNADAQLAEQRKKLAGFRDDLRDRDMAVVEIIAGRANTVMGPGTGVNAPELMKSLNLKGDRFEVVLLGKDTGIKLRSERPVSTQALFSLIDSMPMRQREMKRGSQSQ